ncbi:metallophosphoesterase, partial [Pseudorhodobacter sp. W20_MBD10_FR17]|uniref:metallophosphoesterase n=1 Tax=Pseudorhodobacter sp. W20_MBD10_FR17 TaxID=3240266 RepID=UPI003F99296A
MRAAPAIKDTSRILPLDPHKGPIYAVGDVHGCKSLLLDLLAQIEQDAAGFPDAPAIVLLGDVIDRGPDSAGVLDYLTGVQHTQPVQSILGNHERMMLSFFAAPKQNLGWLDLGGFETLRSYGLALTAQDAAEMTQRRLMQTLSAHVPEAHLDWLAALPHGYRVRLNNEDFLLVHAGYDPALTDSAQHEDVLLWGRPPSAAGSAQRRDAQPSPLRSVQGHKIVSTPDISAQCIQIDTGAWQSGKLSALR